MEEHELSPLRPEDKLLQRCFFYDWTALVRLLRLPNTPVNHRTPRGLVPLTVVLGSEINRRGCLSLFLRDRRVDATATDDDGHTALTWICAVCVQNKERDEPKAVACIASGKNLNLSQKLSHCSNPNLIGATALEIAQYRGLSSLVELLQEYAIKPRSAIRKARKQISESNFFFFELNINININITKDWVTPAALLLVQAVLLEGDVAMMSDNAINS